VAHGINFCIYFAGGGYVGHASQLAPTLAELRRLEKEAQGMFLSRFYRKRGANNKA